jgi:hypothetical protein
VLQLWASCVILWPEAVDNFLGAQSGNIRLQEGLTLLAGCEALCCWQAGSWSDSM